MRQIIPPNGNGAIAVKAAEEIPAASVPPVAASSFLGERHVALAEQSIESSKKLRLLALRATSAEDWTDFGGTPYLHAAGALKIATAFGISLSGLKVDSLREKLDEHEVIRFVARATAKFLGREVDVEGVASSDDPFFARKNGRQLPLAEVNLSSVRKKALTNAQARAVKAVLGLQGVTWQEVRAAGIRKDAVPQVEYSKPKASQHILAALAQ